MLDVDIQNFRELIFICGPVMVLAKKKGNLTSECHMTLTGTSRVLKQRLCLLIPELYPVTLAEASQSVGSIGP